LAYAASADSSPTNLEIVLGGLFIVTLVAILAFALIAVTRNRAPRRSEVIAVGAFFWAAISIGTLIYAGVSRMNWEKEHQLQLESGYLDPTAPDDSPPLPWKTWTVLGGLYAVAVISSLSSKPAKS
jgi:hypothetical protein